MSYGRTQFDRQRHEARIGAMKGPTHIVDRQWTYNNRWNSHSDGAAYAEKMVEQGYWKRCPVCEKIFNPMYEHECGGAPCQQHQ